MMDWQAVIQRAAYTRFCKVGSLDPFLLARADLLALARQASGLPLLDVPADAKIQVKVPVALGGDTVQVAVEEWQREPAVITSGHGTS